MSNFKMPSAYHPSNAEWVRPIESLTSDSAKELQRLQAENAKLRELVKQMYPIARAYLQFGVTLGRIDGMSYDWALQMIELGVEVDG